MLHVEARRRKLAHLGDTHLLQELSRLDLEDRRIQVELLLHLTEVECRRLHLSRGFASLFAYCTRHLRWAESAAGRRIAVARAAWIIRSS